MSKETGYFSPMDRNHWRAWLQENHDQLQSVWLIYTKKKALTPSITYSEAVEEALCFGWIDSRVQPIDEVTYQQFFCRRKPTSVWSAINKARIQQLTDQGLMTPAGLASIAVAKQNGTWTLLDDVEALIVPADLEEAFRARPDARNYFTSLSRSDQKAILQWLVLAKRPETRQNRLIQLVELSANRQKPAFLQRAKKDPPSDL